MAEEILSVIGLLTLAFGAGMVSGWVLCEVYSTLKS